MGTFAEHNFGNDGAMAYLSVLTSKLIATIKEVCADEGRLEADEDGETLLMPSVEVLALLCERYDAAPPRPTTIRQWHEKYLAAFDASIDKMSPPPGFKTGRRKMIAKTIDVSVTSVLQTTAGKMIFGKYDERLSSVFAERRDIPTARDGQARKEHAVGEN